MYIGIRMIRDDILKNSNIPRRNSRIRQLVIILSTKWKAYEVIEFTLQEKFKPRIHIRKFSLLLIHTRTPKELFEIKNVLGVIAKLLFEVEKKKIQFRILCFSLPMIIFTLKLFSYLRIFSRQFYNTRVPNHRRHIAIPQMAYWI